MFLVDKSRPELGLWCARLSVQLVLDRRTAKTILRGYRCSLLPRQDKHAKAANKKCVMRKWQIRAGCGWLSFSVSLDANKTTWRLFTFGCDTLEAASAASQDAKTAVNSRAAGATGAVQQLCWKQTSSSKIRSNPLSIEASEKLNSHKPECCSQSASRFQGEAFIQFLRMNFL